MFDMTEALIFRRGQYLAILDRHTEEFVEGSIDTKGIHNLLLIKNIGMAARPPVLR